MNLDDALNAECITIATNTARPDELKAYAMTMDKPTTIRMYVAGEELLQLKRKSGACHSAHRIPTHIAASHGGITLANGFAEILASQTLRKADRPAGCS